MKKRQRDGEEETCSEKWTEKWKDSKIERRINKETEKLEIE